MPNDLNIGLDGLDDFLNFRSPRISMETRVARTTANDANRIDSWLRAKYPEFVDIKDLWFTGSSVWSHLYGEDPRPDCDLDIIAKTPQAAAELKRVVSEMELEVEPTGKTETSLGGERIYTKRGSLDLWDNNDPLQAIRDYAGASHAHARAAAS